MRRLILAAAFSLFSTISAYAGSGCSSIVTGAVLTAAQWNACFQQKQNELGYTPVNKAGDSMTGLLTTVAPTTTTAGFRLNPGTAPTVPTNGDIWTTSSGLYVQVNGATIGPITGGAAGSFAGTSPITVSFPAGVVTYAFDFSIANVFTARQTINLNGTATPTPISGAGFVVNPANATVGRVQVNAYGAIASFTGAIYAGTAAAPTQVLSGTQLTGINAYAYTGSALVGPIGSFRLYAAENITATAWGTKACIATTPSTTAVLTDSLCQQNSGGVTIGAPTGGDKGAGTLNAASTIYINGTAVTAAGITALTGDVTATGPGSVAATLATSQPAVHTWALSQTFSSAIIYGGVTLSNAVTGTGNMVLSASPTFTGTITAAIANFSGAVTVSGAGFGLSGNISAPAWTTAGVRYVNVSATLTDTTSTGTVAAARTDNFGGNTIAASSAVTYTSYYSAYFSNPTAGTNVTFTNKSAIGADSVSIGGQAQSTFALAVNGTANFASAGSAAVPTLSVGNSTTGFRSVSTTGFGISINALNVLDFGITQGGVWTFDTTNAATVVIKNLSILAASGLIEFGGNIALSGGAASTILGIAGSSAWTAIDLFTTATPVSLSSPGANILQHGRPDTTVAVAQTIRTQSVVAGTAAASGANWTFIGSLPTGTGTSGDIIFQTGVKTGSGTTQGTATTALTIKGETQAVVVAGSITATLANTATTSAVCYNTGTGLFTYNSTVGTCTVSTIRAKELIAPLTPKEGYDLVMAMKAWRYELKKDRPTYVAGEQIGFIAEEAAVIDARVVATNPDGTVAGFRYEQFGAALQAAFKYMQAENDNAKAANDNLRAEVEKLKAAR